VKITTISGRIAGITKLVSEGLFLLFLAVGIVRGYCADNPAAAGTGTTPSSPTSTNVLSPSSVGPLLDLFVKKGFVTQEEADQVKAEAEAAQTNQQAIERSLSKWKISDDLGIKSVELFGDLRLRYESRTATDPKDGSIGLQRYRYSVRIGVRGEVFDDFYYGLRLETSQNPRSSFVTFGSSPNSGPFNKNEGGSAAIEVGQVYLGWKPGQWMDVTLGKMPNPIFTTTMVWSGSINPEGAAERFKYTVGPADFFATFGQFIYADTNPTEAAPGYFSSGSANGSVNGYTPFLLAWQAGVNYHITKKISVKVAPVIYQYTAFNNGQMPPDSGPNSSTPNIAYAYVGQGQTVGVNGKPAYYNLATSAPGYNGYFANQSGINDLLVLEIPFELNVQLDEHSLRFFGDYAQNLDGVDRANAAYAAAHSQFYSASGPTGGTIQQISSPQTGATRAYQAGIAYGSKDCLGLVNGSVSARHAWEVRTFWQHIEQYALDPNLIDTDFFNANENMQGIYVAAAYGLAANVIGTVRYGYANRINDKLGTGGSSPDISQMNAINHYNIFQVDMTFRF
jgi:Putative porin